MIDVGIDWDVWRTEYDRLSFQDQQDFYAEVARLHPLQESHDLEAAHRAFDTIGGTDLQVRELGGWNGRLAAAMLARDDVAEWINYDIADVPQACAHPGYDRVVLSGYLWDNVVEGDVFVASHTIEHLRVGDLASLFDVLRTDWVYLEAPLQWEATSWAGYPGSHILEVGWREVDAMLSERGYRLQAPGLWRQQA